MTATTWKKKAAGCSADVACLISLSKRAQNRLAHLLYWFAMLMRLAIAHGEIVEHVAHLPVKGSCEADVVVKDLPEGAAPALLSDLPAELQRLQV